MLSVTQACCYVPIEYGVIVAHAIVLIWTCTERIIGAPTAYGQNERSVISFALLRPHKLYKPFLRRTEFLIVLIEECYTESHILVLDRNKAEVFEKLSHGDGYADQYAFVLIGKTAKQVHICRAKSNVRLKSVLCCLFTDDLRKMGLSANTFYRRVREYEAEHGIAEPTSA